MKTYSDYTFIRNNACVCVCVLSNSLVLMRMPWDQPAMLLGILIFFCMLHAYLWLCATPYSLILLHLLRFFNPPILMDCGLTIVSVYLNRRASLYCGLNSASLNCSIGTVIRCVRCWIYTKWQIGFARKMHFSTETVDWLLWVSLQFYKQTLQIHAIWMFVSNDKRSDDWRSRNMLSQLKPQFQSNKSSIIINSF